MCLVCVEWQAGRLTNREAIRNLSEMVRSTEDEEQNQHYYEVIEKVLDKDIPLNETDSELDSKWHEENHKDE